MDYRTEWTIGIRAQLGSEVDVRVYTEANNSIEAIAMSRRIALDAVHPGKDKEVVGQPFCVDVPGVNSDRGPEIQNDGRWTPVNSR